MRLFRRGLAGGGPLSGCGVTGCAPGQLPAGKGSAASSALSSGSSKKRQKYFFFFFSVFPASPQR